MHYSFAALATIVLFSTIAQQKTTPLIHMALALFRTIARA